MKEIGQAHVLSPAEVASIFGVDPKTVSRWEEAGILVGFRTPGGHRRFLRSVVEALRATTSGEIETR